MIIEDSSNVPYTYKGSHDTYLQYAASTPKLDPAVLVPYLAQATKHLGLVPTLSVTRISAVPAGAAGQLARSRHRRPHRLELRHRQQRRRGAELRPRQAPAARRALRRRRRVRRRGDAAVGGLGARRGRARPRERRCSPTAARSIRSTTRASTSRCRGPLNAPRSPQGRVPICQAGGSPRGQQFASRWADTIITDGGGSVDVDEGLSRRTCASRPASSAAIPTTSRCCSSPIRSSTPRWRRRASAGGSSRPAAEKHLDHAALGHVAAHRHRLLQVRSRRAAARGPHDQRPPVLARQVDRQDAARAGAAPTPARTASTSPAPPTTSPA